MRNTHKHTQLVKCEVCGDRLDLEFIVTGGAQFKVSTAALGTNAASSLAAGPTALCGSGTSRLPSRLDEEVEELDTSAAADTADAEAELAGSRATKPSKPQGSSVRSKSAPVLAPQKSADGSTASTAGSTADPFAAITDAGPAAAGPAGAGARRHVPPQMADSLDLLSDDSVVGCESAARLQQDSSLAERSSGRSLDGQGPTSMGSRTLGRWMSRYSSGTSSSYGVQGGIGSSPPVVANGFSLSAVAAGQTRPGFVRSLGSLTLGASADDGTRSSFRPVKTDDGEYIVWVEAFSLSFGCVLLRLLRLRMW